MEHHPRRESDNSRHNAILPKPPRVGNICACSHKPIELRAHTEALGLDFSKFWRTCDNWKAGILSYFDGRYTSAAVEGINNKARVITNRCYGVKTAKTLFSRLILDLNRASDAVGRGIAELR